MRVQRSCVASSSHRECLFSSTRRQIPLRAVGDEGLGYWQTKALWTRRQRLMMSLANGRSPVTTVSTLTPSANRLACMTVWSLIPEQVTSTAWSLNQNYTMTSKLGDHIYQHKIRPSTIGSSNSVLNRITNQSLLLPRTNLDWTTNQASLEYTSTCNQIPPHARAPSLQRARTAARRRKRARTAAKRRKDWTTNVQSSPPDRSPSELATRQVRRKTWCS